MKECQRCGDKKPEKNYLTEISIQICKNCRRDKNTWKFNGGCAPYTINDTNNELIQRKQMFHE